MPGTDDNGRTVIGEFAKESRGPHAGAGAPPVGHRGPIIVYNVSNDNYTFCIGTNG